MAAFILALYDMKIWVFVDSFVCPNSGTGYIFFSPNRSSSHQVSPETSSLIRLIVKVYVKETVGVLPCISIVLIDRLMVYFVKLCVLGQNLNSFNYKNVFVSLLHSYVDISDTYIHLFHYMIARKKTQNPHEVMQF
jgi:hypothetical protein